MDVEAGTILVADDDAGIRNLLERLLRAQGHLVVTAQDGAQALARLAEVRPDLLLLDVMMPEVDGPTLCRLLKGDSTSRQVPIILMTATTETESAQRESGADALLRKPFDKEELLAWVRCLLVAKQATKDFERTENALISLATAIEARSQYGPGHLWRVTQYSMQLAALAGLGDNAISIIRRAALLHDVGMVGVPEMILLKPGPLTPDEFEQVKRHAILGADICRSLPQGKEISVIVRGHHERWDGEGYPDGLADADIPLGARIIAIADAFDAHTTDRPYRAAMSPADALEILMFGAGSHWDPDLVALFEPVSRSFKHSA